MWAMPSTTGTEMAAHNKSSDGDNERDDGSISSTSDYECSTLEAVGDCYGAMEAGEPSVSAAGGGMPPTPTELLRTQLNAQLDHPSLYAIYLLTVRFRIGFLAALAFVILLVSMIAFVMAVFFSAVLPEDNDDGWALRAAFLLPAAPLALIVGSWLLDNLVKFVRDAVQPGVLVQFRSALAAVIHTARNWKEIETGEGGAAVADDEAQAAATAITITVAAGANAAGATDGTGAAPASRSAYAGPRVARSTVLVVDCVVPLLFEVVLVAGLVHGGAETGTVSGAANAAVTYGLGYVVALAAVFAVDGVLTDTNAKCRAVYKWMRLTGPRLQLAWDVPPPATGAEGSDNAEPPRRVANLGRHLRKSEYWYERELKRREKEAAAAASSEPVLPLDITLEEPRESEERRRVDRVIARMPSVKLRRAAERRRAGVLGLWARFVAAVPFRWRISGTLAFFALVAALAVAAVVPFELAFFFLVLATLVAGLTIRERAPNVLGRVFVVSLSAFCVFSLALYGVARSGLVPFSDVVVLGGDGAAVVPSEALSAAPAASVGSYGVCRRTYGGLTALDLALVSLIVYARNDDEFDNEMRGAFGATSDAAFEVVGQQESDDSIIHWKTLRFNSTGLTVVAVRGTTTPGEAYTNLRLFAPISLFTLADNVLPVTRSMPEAALTSLMAGLALDGLSSPPSWKPLLRHVEGLADAAGGRPNILLTGHSLGGALAMAVGSRVGLESLVFAAPAVLSNRKRFGFTSESLARNALSVIADNDVVPLIDYQGSGVQRIACSGGSPGFCHTQKHYICELKRVCGDVRGRDFSALCGEGV